MPTVLVGEILNPHYIDHFHLESSPAWATFCRFDHLDPVNHVPESSANWEITIPVSLTIWEAINNEREQGGGDHRALGRAPVNCDLV